MNIALLSQAIQGSMARTGTTDGDSPGTGGFLDLLSAMLTPMKGSEELINSPQLEEISLPEGQVDLDEMAHQLETWFQKPETLKWLKSLPQDAYRTFMDAYVGLLGQLSTSSGQGDAVSSETISPFVQTFTISNEIVKAGSQSTHMPLTKHLPNQELSQHVQTIRQIITQFNGPGGNIKEVPILPSAETVKTTPSIPHSGNIDWLPKGLNWSRPQIDVDSVMYTSKGSLPENLQARIEAALQKAPFQSGADGSKVFTVRLYPEQLGELVVKLERKNGELVVKLFASNQEAKQLIQSQVQQLQQTLTPHSQNVRVEVNLTQQALDAKSAMSDGSEQSEQEQPQEQPRGGSEDDEHPTEDE